MKRLTVILALAAGCVAAGLVVGHQVLRKQEEETDQDVEKMAQEVMANTKAKIREDQASLRAAAKAEFGSDAQISFFREVPLGATQEFKKTLVRGIEGDHGSGWAEVGGRTFVFKARRVDGKWVVERASAKDPELESWTHS